MDVLKIVLMIFLIICALTVSRVKNLLSCIIIFMSYSCVMSLIWVLLQSPDLAITEAAVGAGVSGVMMLVTLKKIHMVDGGHKDEKDDENDQQ